MRIVAQAVAVLVAIVSAVFTVIVVQAPRQSHSSYVSPPGAVHTFTAATALSGSSSAVLFVGDSYTAGALGIDSSQTFPQQTCLTLGLICNLDAEGSTGYQSSGHLLARTNRPYVKRLAGDARIYNAGLVIVSGGRNDVGVAGDEFSAVLGYLRALRATYPKARIVVLEPFWTSVHAPRPMVSLRSEVKRAAGQAGATYISTSGWLTRSGVAGDGVHPNLEGHRELAARLSVALRESGLLEQPREPA